MYQFLVALLVVSVFADEKPDAKQGDKKHAKRGILGLGYPNGYSLGYSSGLGYGHAYSGHGYSVNGYSGHGYSSLGYSGLGHGSYIANAPIASAHYIQPHTHTHSVETKVVAQPYPVVQKVAVPQVSVKLNIH